MWLQFSKIPAERAAKLSVRPVVTVRNLLLHWSTLGEKNANQRWEARGDMNAGTRKPVVPPCSCNSRQAGNGRSIAFLPRLRISRSALEIDAVAPFTVSGVARPAEEDTAALIIREIAGPEFPGAR